VITTSRVTGPVVGTSWVTVVVTGTVFLWMTQPPKAKDTSTIRQMSIFIMSLLAGNRFALRAWLCSIDGAQGVLTGYANAT
jgi:hypothetical protein